MRREFVTTAVTLFWLLTVGVGFWAWDRYESVPGALGRATTVDAATRTRSWELTLFAHPHCPCTRASFDALAELVRESPALEIRVAFVRPPGASAEWERSDSWTAASAVPGARVNCDVDGNEATRVGAATSGTAVLSDPNGRIVFRGGLTPRRGHGHEGPGFCAVRDWLRGGSAPASAPVFGCPLFDTHD